MFDVRILNGTGLKTGHDKRKTSRQGEGDEGVAKGFFGDFGVTAGGDDYELFS